MGLIPLMLILELVLYVSYKIFRDENKVIFAAAVVSFIIYNPFKILKAR